jgi:hypothetical protein
VTNDRSITQGIDAGAYQEGQRFIYVDRAHDGPDKVTVRLGVVAGDYHGASDVDTDLIPVVEPGTPATETPRLITAADVIGAAPQPTEPNRHMTNRLPNPPLRGLSRAGRHRRRADADQPSAGKDFPHPPSPSASP